MNLGFWLAEDTIAFSLLLLLPNNVDVPSKSPCYRIKSYSEKTYERIDLNSYNHFKYISKGAY